MVVWIVLRYEIGVDLARSAEALIIIRDEHWSLIGFTIHAQSLTKLKMYER